MPWNSTKPAQSAVAVHAAQQCISERSPSHAYKPFFIEFRIHQGPLKVCARSREWQSALGLDRALGRRLRAAQGHLHGLLQACEEGVIRVAHLDGELGDHRDGGLCTAVCTSAPTAAISRTGNQATCLCVHLVVQGVEQSRACRSGGTRGGRVSDRPVTTLSALHSLVARVAT